eukprot:5119251-Prymnesium_polylepis.1
MSHYRYCDAGSVGNNGKVSFWTHFEQVCGWNESTSDRTRKRPAWVKDLEATLTKVEVGAPVLARYHGKLVEYPGKVVADNGDGTFDVRYDNGERENGIFWPLVRLPQSEESESQDVAKQGEGVKPIPSNKAEAGYLGVYPSGSRFEAQYGHRSLGNYETAWEAGVAVAKARATLEVGGDNQEKEGKATAQQADTTPTLVSRTRMERIRQQMPQARGEQIGKKLPPLMLLSGWTVTQISKDR